MQIIIIDPLLKNQSGHQFSHAIALQAEFEKRGIPVVILGNENANARCLELRNFYPCLKDISSEIFNAPSRLRCLYRIYSLIRLSVGQWERFFVAQARLARQEGSVFLLYSMFIFELLAFSIFLRKRAKLFADCGHKIIIGFSYGYQRHAVVETLVFSFLYKFVFTFLVRGLNKQTVYFSFHEPTSRNYERLLKKKVYFFPPPLNNQFSAPYILESKHSASTGKIVISYIGGARYNKGFDIFVEMLLRLLQEEGLAEDIRFLVQIDIHKYQSRKEQKAMLESASVLENLVNKSKNIKLAYGALSMQEYYHLLSESDIVLLPYREKAFRFLSSGIFKEAILFGKVPLVSNNTGIACELKKHNLSDLIFDIEDIENSISVIKRVVKDIDSYGSRIKSLQQDCLKFYSVAGLVDQLLKLC